MSRECRDDHQKRWSRISEHALSRQVMAESEMLDVGAELASLLKAGDVVALIGDLGAGKTRLVKAIARSCGVPDDEVSSPTFTLVHEYSGRHTIRHCDTYRLRHPEEFADLGLDELFSADGIAFVEWADRVEEFLPKDRLVIRILITGPDTRLIQIESTGTHSAGTISQLSTS